MATCTPLLGKDGYVPSNRLWYRNGQDIYRTDMVRDEKCVSLPLNEKEWSNSFLGFSLGLGLSPSG